jgi:hypothetical protein
MNRIFMAFAMVLLVSNLACESVEKRGPEKEIESFATLTLLFDG